MTALLAAALFLLSNPGLHPLLGEVDGSSGALEEAPLGIDAGPDGAATGSGAAPVLLASNDQTPPPAPLDFDLLGDEKKTEADPNALRIQQEMKTRRTMLTIHQLSGFALSAAMLGTMVTGQLNYADHFGGSTTGRYTNVHTGFAVTTEVLFAATGALALFAPVPIVPDKGGGITRADVHRFSMLAATAGMFTEAGLGAWTASREGYANQSTLGTAHLVVGYVTLAAMMLAVGALVF